MLYYNGNISGDKVMCPVYFLFVSSYFFERDTEKISIYLSVVK